MGGVQAVQAHEGRRPLGGGDIAHGLAGGPGRGRVGSGRTSKRLLLAGGCLGPHGAWAQSGSSCGGSAHQAYTRDDLVQLINQQRIQGGPYGQSDQIAQHVRFDGGRTDIAPAFECDSVDNPKGKK